MPVSGITTGNGTFTRINGLFDNNDMEIICHWRCVNRDGWIDIMASYAKHLLTKSGFCADDVLWLNNGSIENIIIAMHLATMCLVNNFFNVVLKVLPNK